MFLFPERGSVLDWNEVLAEWKSRFETKSEFELSTSWDLVVGILRNRVAITMTKRQLLYGCKLWSLC